MLRIDPEFLTSWVAAELEAAGESGLLEARAMLAPELDDDEARAGAAEALVERRGLMGAMAAAADGLGQVEVREARGAVEVIERAPAKLFAGPSCIAWLKPIHGAAARLRELAAMLSADPSALRAELQGPLGGTPGCAAR